MRIAILRHLVVIAVVAALTPAAGAAFFAAYSSQRHDRFTAGTTPNPNFLLSGYDLSGVAFDSASNVQGTVLISPQHVIGAWHYRPGTIDFLGTDGIVRNYGVTWQRLMTDGSGSDVAIGRLTTAILPADNINPLPLAIGPDSAFVGHELYAFAAGNRAGRNLIDFVGLIDGDPNPTFVTAYDFDSYTNGGSGGVGDDEIGLAGGDSGHASLMVVDGVLGVLGTHYAVSEAPGQDVYYSSFSSLGRDYLLQIQDILDDDGYTLATLTVPEPAGVLIFGGLAMLLIRRRSVAA